MPPWATAGRPVAGSGSTVDLPQLVELVGEGVAGEHALADGLDLVQPAVARVAGLEPRRRVQRRARCAQVDPAAVLDEDQRTVVGLDQRPYVEGAGAVRPDQQPVGGGTAVQLGSQPFAGDVPGLDL